MVIPFYFIISWLMVGLVILNERRNRGWIREVSFLVFLTCLINTHTYLGLFQTYNWINLTTNPKLFIAFLLFRSVFIPFFLTFFTLKIFNTSLKKKFTLILLYSLLIIGLDIIGLHSHLYSFKKWNYVNTIIYYFIFLIILLAALRWFRGLDEQEVKKTDDVGREGI